MPSDGEDARLRRDGERIEALLGELSGMAGPQTWPLIEELVHAMVGLYGAGLERVLRHARAAGATAALDDALAGDELVSSLLLLHGLHPHSTEARARRALERVRPYLGSHGGGVELVSIEGDTAHLALSGSCDGCPSSRATVEHTLRQALEEDAPEIARIEVQSARGELVQIGAPKKTRWEDVTGLDRIARGEALEVAGVPVLVLRIGGALLAYRNRCASCAARLDPARVSGEVLTCACGRGYEVARGGRAIEAGTPPLEPLPLLPIAAGHRLAIPGAP